jgi:nicotinamide-nucleotide amidase
MVWEHAGRRAPPVFAWNLAARTPRLSAVNLELINTGTELMLGRVLNTHQQWLCRQLADAGYAVTRQVAVADSGPAIQTAIREALSRADGVLVTGGLGPTSDDLTRELIAQLLGRSLHVDTASLEHLRDFFARRSRAMPPSTAVQAQVPEGAIVLLNAFGTAPGLILDLSPNPFRAAGRPSWLLLLPGPPRELHPMFLHQALPWIRTRAPLSEPFVCRTLRSLGLGESVVEEKISGALRPFVEAGLAVGYCARPGEVDVRLTARGPNAEATVRGAEEAVLSRIGRHVFGRDDDEIEGVVVQLLAGQGKTLVTAESCTGGLIAHRLTNVPGASEVFLGGWVTYSNEAKLQALGVNTATLSTHGAVSEPVAREMAEGARRLSGADFALAVSGIAGPGGGAPSKPVGTVFIALARSGKSLVLPAFNPWDRATFKQVTSQQALELLRRTLADTGDPHHP